MTNCETCRFFVHISASEKYIPSGVCKRYPPQIFAALGKDSQKTPYIATKYPVVRIDDWCGEHKDNA